MEWCKLNDLELNTSKCKIMTFSRKPNPILATYTINGQPIDRVSEMRDLGVLMDSKLNFNYHLEYMKKKADTMMAFVRRECYNSFNIDIAKTLYSSLVRSNLEFASVIWKPYHSVHKQLIESTQKSAVIYFRGDNINRRDNGYVLAPYIDRCKELGLTTLCRKRVNADVLFIKP